MIAGKIFKTNKKWKQQNRESAGNTVHAHFDWLIVTVAVMIKSTNLQ